MQTNFLKHGPCIYAPNYDVSIRVQLACRQKWSNLDLGVYSNKNILRRTRDPAAIRTHALPTELTRLGDIQMRLCT